MLDFLESLKKLTFVLLMMLCLQYGMAEVATAMETNYVFNDIKEDSKYFVSVNYLYHNNIVSGYDSGSFEADRFINRAEFMKMVVGQRVVDFENLAEDKDCFLDVKAGEWYAPYVCYAKSQGWVEGYADGFFRPERFVQRDEAVKIIAEVYEVGNFANFAENEMDSEDKFPIDVLPENWSYKYVVAMNSRQFLEFDVISGGLSFQPVEKASRGYISEVLYKALVTKGNNLSNFGEYTVEGPFMVSRVIDGDTIHVKNGEEIWKIRFIGVDTPETVHPDKPVEFFGVEASNKVKGLIQGQFVMLESDDSQANQDKYGRYLRYVRLLDGQNLNQKLILEGYGFEYTYNSKPYKYKAEFDKAEAFARENNLGLWGEQAQNAEFQNGNDSNQSNPELGDLNEGKDYYFYVSSQARTKYYCETDLMWQNLSTNNLLKYEYEEKLKNDFPNLSLNKPC